MVTRGGGCCAALPRAVIFRPFQGFGHRVIMTLIRIINWAILAPIIRFQPNSI